MVGLGYWVASDARRHGFATRAVQLGSSWALQTLIAARVEAWAAVNNEPSQRVLSAAGFTWEGVLRAFLGEVTDRVDMVVFSRITGDLQKPGPLAALSAPGLAAHAPRRLLRRPSDAPMTPGGVIA